MTASLAEAFRSSFARRSAAMMGPDQTVVDQPGVCGTYGSVAAPAGRLLVTDDRALPFLQDLGPVPPVQIVNVFASAPQSDQLVAALGGWEADDATAMVCQDLSRIPSVSLPEGLTVRAVRRVPEDPTSGVALEQAALACQRADPLAADQPLDGFVTFLKSLPTTTRLLAALDEQGLVRATAGASALGPDSNAYFVSTDAEWRRQGVATAMTAAALTWAHGEGAEQACLDASDAGVSIYLRLGFEPVGRTRLYVRFG